jgi:transcriptional regulator of arginine metabolism
MNTYAVRTAADEDAAARRDTILELVASERIASQSELARLLRKRGFHATQATLSRDLKSLGIGKLPSEDGSYYVLPAAPREVLDARRQTIGIEAFVQSARVVNNLVIVRTPPGNAHGVARAIDLQGWTEVAGTLAGDDTILVVTEDRARANRFRKRLSELTGRSLA